MRLFIILAMALTACTDGGRPLVIRNNLAPAEDGCTFTTNNSAITRGQIDVQADDGYLFAALVENDAEAGTDNESARRALIQGADVELTLQEGFEPAGDPAQFEEDAAFTEYFSGVVEPNGAVGYFTFIVLPKKFMEDYIEPNLGAGSDLSVTARITIFGQMGGGDTESIPFNYPIDVCNGCMTIDLGACAELPEDFEGSAGGVCNTLQDVALECCDDGSVCPALPPPPA
jgi:hypothetical protein